MVAPLPPRGFRRPVGRVNGWSHGDWVAMTIYRTVMETVGDDHFTLTCIVNRMVSARQRGGPKGQPPQWINGDGTCRW